MIDFEGVFKQLGIADLGTINKNELIIKDSDDWSSVYSKVQKNEDLELDKQNMLINERVGELNYEGKDYNLKLVYNFEEDMYKAIIKGKDDVD